MSADLPSAMAQSDAQSTVEKLCSQSQKYSINSNDALVTLICKAFETTAIALAPTSDKVRMDLAITSLDNDRKLILQFEKNGFDVLRHLSFGLIETIQVLLEMKGKNIEEQNQTLVEESVSAAELDQMQQRLLESDGKLKRAVEKAGEYKARVEVLENIIDKKEGILGNANGTESHDELRNKVAVLTRQLEEERKTAAELRKKLVEINDQMKQSEERFQKRSDDTRRDHQAEILYWKATTGIKAEQLEVGEEDARTTAQEVKKKVDELTNQLEEERRISAGLRETLAELEKKIAHLQQSATAKQPLPVEKPALHGPAEDPTELPQSSDSNSVESSTQTLESDFGANNTTLSIDNPMNELPLNDKDSRVNMVPSDVMGEDMNSKDDPIVEDRNSIQIEMNTFENLSSNGENLDESGQTEMMGEANELMEEDEEKDKRVDHTTNTPKDSSETGEAEKKRPKRTSTKPVKYTESFNESEPPEKMPRMKSEKIMDNKMRSDVDEYSSKPPRKVIRVSKINHTELECPNCEYRSRSVPGWYMHLTRNHSTNPRDLGLALLCECGYESFSFAHSVECEISKITIIQKNATPQCVMCKAHPMTAYGYACHLQDHHKTTLIQKGIFLICSCGHEVRSGSGNPQHTKKCNGHDYTLHKLEDE